MEQDNERTSGVVRGLVGKLLLRAFRIYKDRAERSSGDDVTI